MLQPCMTNFLAGLQRLADALAAAKVDEEYLMLPDDLPVELPAPLRTSIYVRAAYRRVIPRLCIAEGGSRTTFPEASRTTTLDGAGSAVVEDAAKGVPLARSTRTFLGHVLTGPPGSGTSSIAPLVVAHLAQHKQPVLYRYFNPRSLEQYVMLDFTCSPPCVDIEYADRPKRLAGKVPAAVSTVTWDQVSHMLQHAPSTCGMRAPKVVRCWLKPHIVYTVCSRSVHAIQ